MKDKVYWFNTEKVNGKKVGPENRSIAGILYLCHSQYIPYLMIIKQPIDEFMKTICVTENEAREIEQGTQQQQKSPEWFSAQIQTHIISAWRNFSALSQKSTRCSGCETAWSITVRIPSNTVGYRTWANCPPSISKLSTQKWSPWTYCLFCRFHKLFPYISWCLTWCWGIRPILY